MKYIIKNFMIVLMLVSAFQVKCSIESDEDFYGDSQLDLKVFLEFIDEDFKSVDYASSYKFAATDAERAAFAHYLVQSEKDASENISSRFGMFGSGSNSSSDSSASVLNISHEKAGAQDKEKKIKKKKSPGAKYKAAVSPTKTVATIRKEADDARKDKQRQDSLAAATLAKLAAQKKLEEKEARRNERNLANQRKQMEQNEQIKVDRERKIKADMLEQQILDEAIKSVAQVQHEAMNANQQTEPRRSLGVTVAVSYQDLGAIRNDEDVNACLRRIELGNLIINAFAKECKLVQNARILCLEPNFIPNHDFIIDCFESVLATSNVFNTVIEDDVFLENWAYTRFFSTVFNFFTLYEQSNEDVIPDEIRDLLERIYTSKIDSKTKLLIKLQDSQILNSRIKLIDFDIKGIELMLNKVSLHRT